MKAKAGWTILKVAFGQFGKHSVLRLAAALAYYSMFSIGPLLMIVMGLAGLAFGKDAVHHQVEQQLQTFVGPKAAHVVETMTAAGKQSNSLLATVLGIAVLIFGATGVFAQLQDALNTIWEVKAKPGAGIWSFLRYRVLSFAMILGIGFLLLISMALTTALAALGGAVGSVISMPEWLAHALNFLLSFGVITILFAAMFKVLPDIKLRWRDMWVGAIGTSLLFTIGKYLLAWYLGRESTSSSYGAAGSVVVLLMWVYYGSVILFFGAEFTRAYVKQSGSKVALSKFAVPITEEEMAEQGMASDKKLRAAKAAKNSPAKHQPKPQAVDQPMDEPIGVPVLGLTALAGFIIGTLLELQLSGRKTPTQNAE